MAEDVAHKSPQSPDGWLFDLSPDVPDDVRYPLSNLLMYIWRSRVDLQRAFDLDKRSSRLRYCEWLVAYGTGEYGLRGWAYPRRLLLTLSRSRGAVGQQARSLLSEDLPPCEPVDVADLLSGVNLIGYARGEFGMGEHVRAAAEALDSVDAEFTITNLSEAGTHGDGERRTDSWISQTNKCPINIFHVSPDVMPTLHGRFSPEFFRGRYNIGYFAWELARCPRDFATAIMGVDEIWGVSDFVCEAFRQITDVPVFNMPIAVDLPPIETKLPRARLGIDEDEFTFLFTFDAASYLERKNPLGLIRAFQEAFPSKKERVRLLLKTMNVLTAGPQWTAVAQEAAKEPRITIVDQRLNRGDVLRLYLTCDAFVSLHRSEGFGRCIAEAMALGRPVIATGYSGSSEFVNESTACVVDYELVPVREGSYPFWDGQVWADPDVSHAASHMRRIFEDETFRERLALSGQSFVRRHLHKQAIGTRYAERLKRVGGSQPIPLSGRAVSKMS